jgi:Spy/CpxP family protein refolding chaperone
MSSRMLNEFDDMRRALAHVQEGRVLIARQRALIERLSKGGFSTAAAEDLLSWMEQTQAVFEEHFAEKRQKALERLKRAQLDVARPGSGSGAHSHRS